LLGRRFSGVGSSVEGDGHDRLAKKAARSLYPGGGKSSIRSFRKGKKLHGKIRKAAIRGEGGKLLEGKKKDKTRGANLKAI